MNQLEENKSNQIRAALIASFSIVPVWILFSFYEKGLFYFSSTGGIAIGLYIIVIGVIIAFVATLLIGVPLRMFLRQRGWSSPWYYAIVGALIPPLVVLLFGGYEQANNIGALVNYAGFSITGLVVALTFWKLTEQTSTQ